MLRSYDLTNVSLVGASIGGIIIADYLAAFGTERVRGIALVGSLFSIGQAAGPLWMGPAARLAFGATEVDFTLQYEALKAFVRASGAPLDEGEVERQAAISLMTPPQVRAALLRRDVDHSGTWAEVDRPLILVHGENDQVVPLATAEAFSARARDARLHVVEGGGHLVFRERPAAFKAALLSFRDELAGAASGAASNPTKGGAR